ncbi:MAG: hypothetical protein LC127_08785 [Chitinophagales bacterium]|nr:hypothetical protein [Chitinophagales bacterium]
MRPLTLDGEKYIDPYLRENTDDYILYNVKDHRSDIYDNISCVVEGGAPESTYKTSTLSGYPILLTYGYLD